MRYTLLANTDLSVSTVAMGCWGLAGGPWWGTPDIRESERAIRAGYDANTAAADLGLAPEVIRSLDQATRSLKDRLGPNADLWQSSSRIH